MEQQPQKPVSHIDLQKFKYETVNAHNNYRTLHGCPPLVWSEEISGAAQAWADKLAEKGFLQYSENPALGENICVVEVNGKRKEGEQLVQEWYKEITNYNYTKPGWKKEDMQNFQLSMKGKKGVTLTRYVGAYATSISQPSFQLALQGQAKFAVDKAYRFSQLLWKSTSEIGVGVAEIPGQDKAYVVVNYRPAGNNNMPGEFERNVLPLKEKIMMADRNANNFVKR